MTSRSVVFAEPVRTAIGTFGGSLKDVPAPALGATAIRAAVGRADPCSGVFKTSRPRPRLIHIFSLS